MRYGSSFSYAAFLLVSIGTGCAQKPVVWHDPSPHVIQFVTVDTNVKLEVLDWGGTGRSLVLLAGLGNTAHVFDEFAPKLNPEYHVYGITRRGYSASSFPTSGYSADRLGDDVIAVIDALKLNRPVLVGHSIAGEELSAVATRHPERIAGLVYLDAAYSYAYYDASRGDLNIDIRDLQRKLDKLAATPPNSNLLARELLRTSLPEFERDLREIEKTPQTSPPPSPPDPTADDLANFSAFRAWFVRITGVAYPESEFRQVRITKPDGGVGAYRSDASDSAIIAGEEKYTNLRVPVLAVYAIPHDWGPFVNNNAAARASSAHTDDDLAAQAKAFEAGVPSAHVIRLPHANHYVFISNQKDVLREMRIFLAGLN